MPAWFERLRAFSVRRSLALASASALIFGALVVLWLSVSTRTALLNRQLEQLDEQRFELDQEITGLEQRIGDAAAVQAIEARMKVAGFIVPDKIEYLVPTTVAPAAVITPTSVISPAAGGGQ